MIQLRNLAPLTLGLRLLIAASTMHMQLAYTAMDTHSPCTVLYKEFLNLFTTDQAGVVTLIMSIK